MDQTALLTSGGGGAETVNMNVTFTSTAPKRGRRRGTTLIHLDKSDELNSLTGTADSLLSCIACGKNFVSYGRLKSHEKTHSKTRPFKCIDCGKTFTVRYSLICHTRVHTRERPYHCNICGSRFSQASSLKTHQIYKHTKEFPYICKYCGRGFISPGQKHEHISRTHLKNAASFTAAKRSRAAKQQQQHVQQQHPSQGVNAVGGCAQQAPAQTSGPVMTTAAVQTHLSLPPGPLY